MMNVFQLISFLFEAYKIILVIRIVLTWMPHNRNHFIIEKIYNLTDPYLNIFRSLNINFGGIDFSPIVAFFVLSFIQRLLLQILIF
ncbi:MAG: YggT family protein [Candidatus Margulisbacteria bacterium]|nr:YggT family protein [Candidatus Margulisiibacteriota bacterium]